MDKNNNELEVKEEIPFGMIFREVFGKYHSENNNKPYGNNTYTTKTGNSMDDAPVDDR